MKKLRAIDQNKIIKYWESVDNRGIHTELMGKYVMIWYEAQITLIDIPHIYIIFAADWQNDYSLITNNDWRLNSVLENYRIGSPLNNQRILEIFNRKSATETKLILIAEDIETGPFWIMEGNRRAIAFLDDNRLIGNLVYVGVSKRISHFGLCAPEFKD